jgi:hypothetical protein
MGRSNILKYRPEQSFNMLALLLASNILGSVYSKTITGETCPITNGTGAQETGICVPLDSHGLSWDCSDIYGFLVPEICEWQYGDIMSNVSTSILGFINLFLVLLILKSDCCVQIQCNPYILNDENAYCKPTSGYCKNGNDDNFRDDPHCDFLPGCLLQTVMN